MKKTIKIVSVLLIAVMMFAFMDNTVMATDSGVSGKDVITSITPTQGDMETDGLTNMAGRVLGVIQILSAIIAVILIAYLGFKMLVGSANEKADVQKQFIPLIIGLVIVFAATSIAKVIMSIMSTN